MKYVHHILSFGQRQLSYTLDKRFFFTTFLGGILSFFLIIAILAYATYNILEIVYEYSTRISYSIGNNYFDSGDVFISQGILPQDQPFNTTKRGYESYQLFLAFQFSFENGTLIKNVGKYADVQLNNVIDFYSTKIPMKMVKCNDVLDEEDLKKGSLFQVDFSSLYCFNQSYSLYKKSNKSYKRNLEILIYKCTENCTESASDLNYFYKKSTVNIYYQRFLPDINKQDDVVQRLKQKKTGALIENNSLVVKESQLSNITDYVNSTFETFYTYIEKSSSKHYFIELDFSVYFKNPTTKNDDYLFTNKYSLKYIEFSKIFKRIKSPTNLLLGFRLLLTGSRNIFVYESKSSIVLISNIGGLLISLYIFIYFVIKKFVNFKLNLKLINKLLKTINPTDPMYIQYYKVLNEDDYELSFETYLEAHYNRLLREYLVQQSKILKEEKEAETVSRKESSLFIKNQKSFMNILADRRKTISSRMKVTQKPEYIDLEIISPISNQIIPLQTKVKEVNKQQAKQFATNLKKLDEGKIIDDDNLSIKKSAVKKISAKTKYLFNAVEVRENLTEENLTGEKVKDKFIEKDLMTSNELSMDDSFQDQYLTSDKKIKLLQNNNNNNNDNDNKSSDEEITQDDAEIYISLENKDFEFFQENENLFFKQKEILPGNKKDFIDLYFTLSRIENIFGLSKKERVSKIVKIDDRITNHEKVKLDTPKNTPKIKAKPNYLLQKQESNLDIINEVNAKDHVELLDVNFYKEFFQSTKKTPKYYFNKCLFNIFKLKKYKLLDFNFCEIITKIFCLGPFRACCCLKYNPVMEEKRKIIEKMRLSKEKQDKNLQGVENNGLFVEMGDYKTNVAEDKSLITSNRTKRIEKAKNVFEDIDETFEEGFSTKFFKKCELYDVCLELVNSELDLVNIVDSFINFRKLEFIIFEKDDKNLHRIIPTAFVANSSIEVNGDYEALHESTKKEFRRKDNDIFYQSTNPTVEEEIYKEEDEKRLNYKRNNKLIDHIISKVKSSKIISRPHLNCLRDMLIAKNMLNLIFNKDYLKHSDMIVLLELGISQSDVLAIVELIKEHKLRLFTLEHKYFIENASKKVEKHKDKVNEKLRKSYDYVNYKLEEYISKYKDNVELVADQHYMQKIKYLKGKRKEIELIIEQMDEKNEDNKDEIDKHYFKEIITDLQKKFYLDKKSNNQDNDGDKIIETNQEEGQGQEQEQDDNLETNENQTSQINQNEEFSLNIIPIKSQSKNKDNNLLVNSHEKEMNLEIDSSRDTKQKDIIQIENKKQSLFYNKKSNVNLKLPSKNIDDLEESHDQSNSFAFNKSILKHDKKEENIDRDDSNMHDESNISPHHRKGNYNYDASIDAIESDDE